MSSSRHTRNLQGTKDDHPVKRYFFFQLLVFKCTNFISYVSEFLNQVSTGEPFAMMFLE